MRVSLILSLVLAAGCSGATVVGSSAPGGSGSSAPDGDEPTYSGSDDPVRIESCHYSDGTCLVTERALLSDSPTYAALVGVFYGDPDVSIDDLEVSDLDARDFRENAAIGWAMTCSEYDIGHATSARDDVFEWPLGTIELEEGIEPEMPSGVYRLALRKLEVLYDSEDFEDGLVIVTCDGLADGDNPDNWSYLPLGEEGIWSGDDEDGNEGIASIVVGFDGEDGYDLSWADELPNDLEEIDD